MKVCCGSQYIIAETIQKLVRKKIQMWEAVVMAKGEPY